MPAKRLSVTLPCVAIQGCTPCTLLSSPDFVLHSRFPVAFNMLMISDSPQSKLSYNYMAAMAWACVLSMDNCRVPCVRGGGHCELIFTHLHFFKSLLFVGCKRQMWGYARWSQFRMEKRQGNWPEASFMATDKRMKHSVSVRQNGSTSF